MKIKKFQKKNAGKLLVFLVIYPAQNFLNLFIVEIVRNSQDQVENYSASFSVSDLTVGKATEFIISACRRQEEAYVVAMTNLAMTMTGNMVSREKFLEDKEVTLRGDLRELAASLVEQEL